MRIAIDMDEVLANLLDVVIAFHNDTYQTSLVRADFRSFLYHEVWGGTMEETNQKIQKLFVSPYFDAIQPMPGAVEAIRTLQQNHELFIITSRQTIIEEKTRAWVERHFPAFFREVHLTNAFGSGHKRKKSEVCQELGVELFIDDSLEYALDCARLGIPVLLYTYPWNQHATTLPNNVRRVESWPEIMAQIKTLDSTKN